MELLPSGPAGVTLEQAIKEMLEFFKLNQWFTSSHWPENAPRVTRMLQDLTRFVPASSTVLDPGCGNGYISFLAARLGYRVTATDAWEPEDRKELFRIAGVGYFQSNLNNDDAFSGIKNDSFDSVLFGEIFEHLLQHPVGVLRELHRVLRPAGILILTTPNPSTLANALRTLLDRHTLRGTDDFARMPKILEREIIDKGDIHYREYRSGELASYLTEAGFEISYRGYTWLDSPAGSIRWSVKRVLGQLKEHRLFAASNYIIAYKRAN